MVLTISGKVKNKSLKITENWSSTDRAKKTKDKTISQRNYVNSGKSLRIYENLWNKLSVPRGLLNIPVSECLSVYIFDDV